MSARSLHVMLMGAVFLSTIAPVPTFAEFENTEWRVHDLYKQSNDKGGVDEVFCLEFVSSVARQAFMNGLALEHIKDHPDLMTMSIPSACPKSTVSHDAMVEAFREWANSGIANPAATVRPLNMMCLLFAMSGET